MTNRNRKRNSTQGIEINQDFHQKQREQFLMDFSQSDEFIDNQPSLTSSFDSYPDEIENNTSTKLHMPSKAKQILERWMYEHRFYCYPTKTEKQMLSIKTNLNVQKISNWFINSRRRLLPKMLQKEGQDSVDFTISRKKRKDQIAPTSEPEVSMNIQNKHQTDNQSNLDDVPCVPISYASPAYSANRSQQIIRGILYDQRSDSRCLFIVTN